jgi:hypothetical protein
LNDIKFLMGKIEVEARSHNVRLQGTMSRDDAKKVYEQYNKAVIISETKKGRKRVYLYIEVADNHPSNA